MARNKVRIADLQTQFSTERRHRSMPVSAFRELESGLRTGKSGPRNRIIGTQQLTRRDGRLSRASRDGHQLSWPITTYNDTAIDDRLLESRYGPDSGVSVDGELREVVDLDPSQMFDDDSRELQRDFDAKGWPSRRLSTFLASAPAAVTDPTGEAGVGQIFVPTTRTGKVSADFADTEANGRVLSIQLDGDLVLSSFLAAWLNSEQGIASRGRAIAASSSGTYTTAQRLNPSALMRWADELILPVPGRSAQLALASADERLKSFQAALNTQRASIWASPESAEVVVSRIAPAFDDSLSAWLDQLPFPIASALWTAETADTPQEQQLAYLQAWEAIVAFHATVLLSASRSVSGNSGEVEAAIRQTLQDQHLAIERASFGTWVVIIERTSKDLRQAMESDDGDEIARVRRTFADLGRTSIERLISRDVIRKFKELNTKRNRWRAHGGHTSREELAVQVESLISDLRELRDLLGSSWGQLLLVRAGTARLGREGIIQTAEVASGTRSPFKTQDFSVGEMMMDGELYLVRDGSQSPLRLGHFVQLRAAPSSAQYTSYFYNRTEGTNVLMVSYQYGPHGELSDDVENFRSEFGTLAFG